MGTTEDFEPLSSLLDKILKREEMNLGEQHLWQKAQVDMDAVDPELGGPNTSNERLTSKKASTTSTPWGGVGFECMLPLPVVNTGPRCQADIIWRESNRGWHNSHDLRHAMCTWCDILALTDDFPLLDYAATSNLQDDISSGAPTVVSEGGRLDAAPLEETFDLGERVAHPREGRG